MYRMTVMTIKAYLNSFPSNSTEYRYKMAEPLVGYTSPELYNKWSNTGNPLKGKLDNITYNMAELRDTIPQFDTLLWDLYALGYDSKPLEYYDAERLKEQLKLMNQCVKLFYLDNNN